MEAEGHDLVCTICVLASTAQAGFTKIAGEAEFKLDVRSLSQDSLDTLFAMLHRLVPEEAMRLEDFDAGCRVLMRWLIRSTT
jgi:N-carbamoyl-L-amino-acid hydrolase